MIPLTLPGYNLILIGFLISFVVYVLLRSAVRIMALSVFAMFAGSNMQILLYDVWAYMGYVIGHLGVGLFFGSVVIAFLKLMYYVFREEELWLLHDR